MCLLVFSGWYDIFLNGNLIAYDAFQKYSSPAVRGKSKIVIDPLGHCQGGARFFPKKLIAGRAALPVLLALQMLNGKQMDAENVSDISFYV